LTEKTVPRIQQRSDGAIPFLFENGIPHISVTVGTPPQRVDLRINIGRLFTYADVLLCVSETVSGWLGRGNTNGDEFELQEVGKIYANEWPLHPIEPHIPASLA
jgi:hypothetical protein